MHRPTYVSAAEKSDYNIRSTRYREKALIDAVGYTTDDDESKSDDVDCTASVVDYRTRTALRTLPIKDTMQTLIP